MYIYDVVAKRNEGHPLPDVILFYDEDRETAIKFMQSYVKRNGFTIDHRKFTIANVILREKRPTGEIVSEMCYRELFDIFNNRLYKLKR